MPDQEQPQRPAAPWPDCWAGTATPAALGGVRLLTFALLLYSLSRVRSPVGELLPDLMRRPNWLLRALDGLLPGFANLRADPAFHHGMVVCAGILAAAAAAGLLTRFAVPAAAAACLLVGAVQREYFQPGHPFLVALQIAVALSFMPCGDGFSMDRLIRRRRGADASGDDDPRPVYGRCRFVCRLLLAAPYLASGLWKLRDGGLFWWQADNMRQIIYHGSLEGNSSDFRLGLLLRSAPDWVPALLGLSALTVEVAFVAALFHRSSRMILPAAAVVMHVGILLLQNILFLDMLVLQSLFVDRWPAFGKGSDAGRRTPDAPSEAPALNASMLRSSTPAEAPSSPAAATPNRGFRLVVGLLAAVLCSVAAFQLPWYPLASWRLFTTVDATGVVRHNSLVAVFADGSSREAAHWTYVPELPAVLFHRAVRHAFAGDPAAATPLLDAALRRARERRDDVAAFELQQREWNFRDDPFSPTFGTVVRTIRRPAGPSGAAGR